MSNASTTSVMLVENTTVRALSDESLPPFGSVLLTLRCLALALLFCLGLSADDETSVPGFLVKTIAGGYSTFTGNLGDGELALQGQLAQPLSVAVDGVGNVFIADQALNRIRKVTPAGIITTFAGNGELGYAGDGGPATSAQLRYPQAVTADNAGRVYIGTCDDVGTLRVV